MSLRRTGVRSLMDRALGCEPNDCEFDPRRAHSVRNCTAISTLLERLISARNYYVPHNFFLEDSHSGQLHEFRKLEGVILTQVRILYPPPRNEFCSKQNSNVAGTFES